MKDTLLWSVQCSKRKEVITRSTVQNQYRGGKTILRSYTFISPATAPAAHPIDCLAKTLVAICIR